MIEEILQKLTKIEIENNVKILYAIESGSRGWGFASKDSDFDVRFIYIRPTEEYLRIDDHKDFIELPINSLLDINGWDIRKTLRLFRKSNPPLLEWLSSPIIYRNEGPFIQDLKGLSGEYFSSLPCLHHYLNLARNTYKEMLAAEQVKIKKYFYVLRPLLACMWIDAHKTMAPMKFHDMMAGLELDSDVEVEIDALLARKAVSAEGDFEPENPRLFQFFSETIAYFEEITKNIPKSGPIESADLDQLFRKTLEEVWAG